MTSMSLMMMTSKITLPTTAIATRYSTRYSNFYYYSTRTRLEVKNHYSQGPDNDTLENMARLFVDKYIRHFQFAEERGRERSTWRTHGKLLRANWGNGEVGIFSVGCYVLQLQIGGRGTTKGNGRCFSPTWTSIATLWFPPNRGGYKRQLFVVSLHLEAMAANKLPKMTWLWKSWKKLGQCKEVWLLPCLIVWEH